MALVIRPSFLDYTPVLLHVGTVQHVSMIMCFDNTLSYSLTSPVVNLFVSLYYKC